MHRKSLAILSALALAAVGFALVPMAIAEEDGPDDDKSRAEAMRERAEKHREAHAEHREQARELRDEHREVRSEQHRGWWEGCEERNAENVTPCYEKALARIDAMIATLEERKALLEAHKAALQENLTAGNLSKPDEFAAKREVLHLSVMVLKIDTKILSLEYAKWRIQEAATADVASDDLDDADDDEDDEEDEQDEEEDDE